MPTAALYDSTSQQLTAQLPDARASQIETLALIVVGIAQSVSAQIGKIARALPLDTTQAAKEQRIRRLLDNERVTQTDHYQPLAKAALHGLNGQRVQLLMDRVLLRDTHNILVVSIGFRRRSLPLAWIALAHRGQSGVADQQAVLRSALTLLPERVRVSIHADSEFRSQELFAWIRAHGHDGMLGVPGRTLVALTPDGAATALVTWLPNRETVAYLNGVYLTEDRLGPVNLLAWWAQDDDGKPIVHAVMTNLPATWATYRYGSRRMWIETVFRDWQSGGFHLDDSGVTDRARFARLLVPLVIAYLWFVAVGRWVVKRGYRTLVDDGPARSWKYSLCHIGIAWNERLGSYTQAIPVLLKLYL
ncbi:transposase [Roseiflexus sp.]|uniref:transposase n=1 Tax=Roseiflexus sp. TaxID=2562120 RepID=UPI00398B71FB